MWRITLKHLAARKLRLFTTSFAVMLGVAFVAGSLVLSATISRAFDDLFANVYKDVSAVVRGPATVKDYQGQVEHPPIDATLLTTIRATPGAKAAFGDIQGYAQVIDKNAKPVGGQGPPTFGGIWVSDSSVNPFQLSAGKAPANDNEVVIDKATATKTGYQPGDTIPVLTPSAPKTFRLSGIAKFGTSDSPGGASYVLFTEAAAQELIGEPGKFTEISVVGQQGVSQTELKARLAAALPDNVEVLTGAEITKETQSQIKEGLKFFSIFLLIFAGIALFVGSFIINNTFAILVAQRSKEMALLRAIGARRSQVLWSVIAEAFVVGIVASIVGLGVGVGVAMGLKALFAAFGAALPGSGLVLTSQTVVAAFVLGIGVTVVSVFLPARKASKVAPIAAMRDVAAERTGPSRVRVVIGLTILIIGAGLLCLGLFGDIDKAYIPVGGGAVLTFIGVHILGPVFARPVSRVIGSPLPLLKGTPGTLARENAMRNPRRTSATAAALTIGVTLVTLISILATSAKASLNQVIDRSFSGDFVMDSTNPEGVPASLAKQIKALPEVKEVSPLRFISLEVNGKGVFGGAIDPVSLTNIFDPRVDTGRLADIGNNGIALNTDVAKTNNWKLGDRLSVRFADGNTDSLRLVATYKEGAALPGYTIGIPNYDAHTPQPVDKNLFIAKSPDADAKQAKRAIEGVAAQYPTAKIFDQTQFKENAASQINTVLNVIYVLLTLAVIIALLGIANTLALSILERTRELGLLRAVGMTRRQLRSTIRWESVIIALLGTFLGLIIGTLFAGALVTSLKEEGLSVFSIPFGTLFLIALIAAVAGVIAAIVPAIRASRLNILNAIATN